MNCTRFFISICLPLLLGCLIIAGCEKEEPFQGPEPSVFVLNYEGGLILQQAGGEVGVDVEALASVGLATLQVLVNGEELENQVFEDQFRFTSAFIIEIPEDAPDGENYVYVFRVTDRLGRVAESQAVRIRAGNPFSLTEESIDGIEFTVIKGRINENLELTPEVNWLMDSVVSVENEAVLTIQPGTTVYFRTNPSDQYGSRLVVTQGSRLIAQGTASMPIVLTSDRVLLGGPQRGDWGGLALFGRAETNQGNIILRDGFRYGGTNNSENNGTLSYLRIEYSGKLGFHGLMLNGVGSATSISYIQVWESFNTGFRLRGGRVNLKYIAAINHGGYGLWADEGWQGDGQFWLFQTDIMATLIPVNYWNQARSLEFRSDDSFFLRQPRTTFNISNVTLIGNGWEESGTFGTRRGFRVRRGAYGILQNMLVTNFPNDAARVEDLDFDELGSVMILDNSRVWANRTNWNQEAESYFYESGDFNLSEDPVEGIDLNNFVGSASSPYNPTVLGSFFTSAPYMGAVENEANDWTVTGAWFKDLNGNIR